MRGLVQVFDIINRGWLVPFIWVTQYYWLWATDSTLQICKFIVSAEANWLKAETPRGSGKKKKKKSQFDMTFEFPTEPHAYAMIPLKWHGTQFLQSCIKAITRRV